MNGRTEIKVNAVTERTRIGQLNRKFREAVGRIIQKTNILQICRFLFTEINSQNQKLTANDLMSLVLQAPAILLKINHTQKGLAIQKLLFEQESQ